MMSVEIACVSMPRRARPDLVDREYLPEGLAEIVQLNGMGHDSGHDDVSELR